MVLVGAFETLRRKKAFQTILRTAEETRRKKTNTKTKMKNRSKRPKIDEKETKTKTNKQANVQTKSDIRRGDKTKTGASSRLGKKKYRKIIRKENA